MRSTPTGSSKHTAPKHYTLRNPVPLRTEADLKTTRAGIPTDSVLSYAAGPVDFDSLAKAIRRSVATRECVRRMRARSPPTS